MCSILEYSLFWMACVYTCIKPWHSSTQVWKTLKWKKICGIMGYEMK